ncbi:TetR family transcriptional regulator [Paraflavitalea sp. CAU 1676]|uniref:TetR/AcrR family transcriptional regulator n=1 Tax=Paraflavitalea sp. CAU 1676 TaxID=3032598 RepID=UPI0023DCC273|nr:TetR family transcriptional regulator [Paraflavitalea sp. CAU 1676]MDF2190816.1 TetR family transcriptional regulator [Paraflavitalea sp. CAU 1676]
MSSVEKTDKREHILLVAEDLFAVKGFDGSSVRDIANQAGVNLAMISYYFGSKENLLKELIEFRFRSSVVALEEKSNDPGMSPWEKIEWIIDFYVDRIVNNRRFHSIMTQEYNTARSEEIKELITTIKMQNLERIKKIIAEGQKKGVFRQIDVEMTMATMMGTITQITNTKNVYCVLLRIDTADEEEYKAKINKRLKSHLRDLLHAHLIGK